MRSARSWVVRLFVVLVSILPTSATVALAQPATPVTRDRPGLLRDGEYESPQFGTRITWTDAWTVGNPDKPKVAHAIGGLWDDSVASDPQNGDVIFLSDPTAESAVISIGVSPNLVSLEQYFPVMQDPGYLENNLFMASDSDVLLIDNDGKQYASMLVRDAAPNEDHAIYVVVKFPTNGDDPILSFGIDLYDPATYDHDLTAAKDDLAIDGLDIFPVFNESEVLAALAAAPSGTATPAANDTDRKKLPSGEPATPVASPVASPVAGGDDFPGLVGEGSYQSPLYGDSVEWGDSWVISDAVAQPIVSDPGSGLDSVLLTDAKTERSVLYVTVEPGEFDAKDLLATFADPTYQSDVLGLDDGKVLLSDSTRDAAAVLLRGTTNGVSVVIMLEVRATGTDGVLSYVDLRATDADFTGELLGGVQHDFTLDGAEGLQVFTPEEILNALAS